MIPPLCTRDIYIMEAVSEIGLTKIQLEQINACHMFLQVTTVAEMTDHTGRYLLPQALLQVNQTQPEGLHAISVSTLAWPTIGNPTKSTWRMWTQTICTLFTISANSTQLHNPLGEWMETYQCHHFWKWRIAPTGQLLYKACPMHNTQAAILIQATRTYSTFSLTIPMNQTFQGPPVTPHDSQQRQIRLPTHTNKPDDYTGMRNPDCPVL